MTTTAEMPVVAPSPVEAERAKFVSTGCGSFKEFDAIASLVGVMLDERFGTAKKAKAEKDEDEKPPVKHEAHKPHAAAHAHRR